MSRSTRLFLAAAALACGGLSPVVALGQCDIYRLDIPDFDQRRQASLTTFGLPGNGSTHCVPTAAMNWLAYVTNHGYPEVLGGARNWQSNTHYNAVTLWINNLGTRMGTDGGTYYDEGYAGLVDFIEEKSPDNFIVSVPVTTDYYAPSPEQIYDCMTAGALVNFCTSRWTVTPAQIVQQPGGGLVQLPQRLVRSAGGHCVSVARITDGCTNSPTVWFRDPAGFDGDYFSQAQFVTQYRHTVPLTTWYAATATSAPVHQTLYRLTSDDPNLYSMIHGLYVIIPIGGLSADAQQGTITVMNQHSSSDFAVLPDDSTTHSTPGRAPIIGLGYLPHLGAAAVLTRTGPDQGMLHRFRPGTGEFSAIMVVGSPGALTVGRAGEIYVASRGQAAGINVCMADGSVRFISTGAYRPEALAYDDGHDRLVAILVDSNGAHAVGTLGAFGDGAMSVVPLATGGSTGRITSIAVDPRPAASGGGGIYIAAVDVDGITPLTRTPNGWVMDHARSIPVAGPKDVQIDARGRLFCTSNGVARQFVLTFNGQTTTPVLNTNYKFHGRAVGDIFQVTVGRVGRDSMVPPDHRPIDDPSSFPAAPRACGADFNDSGEVSVQDLFDFLSKYFSGSPDSDFNGSGSLTVQDLFDFLAAYFAGC